jgi:hypothetical protein
MLAYVEYDLTGNLAFAFGSFAAMASLVQMFQIGAMRRLIASLEDRLSSQKDELDVNAAKTTPG